MVEGGWRGGRRCSCSSTGPACWQLGFRDFPATSTCLGEKNPARAGLSSPEAFPGSAGGAGQLCCTSGGALPQRRLCALGARLEAACAGPGGQKWGWEGGAGRSQQRGRRARWVGGQRAHPSYTRRLVRRWMQSAAASSPEHCCLSPLLCNTPRAPISKQPPSPARDGEPQPVAGLSGGGGGGGELCTPGAARRGEHRVGAGNAQSASAWLRRAPRPQLGDTETGGSGVPTPTIPSKPTLP